MTGDYVTAAGEAITMWARVAVPPWQAWLAVPEVTARLG